MEWKLGHPNTRYRDEAVDSGEVHCFESSVEELGGDIKLRIVDILRSVGGNLDGLIVLALSPRSREVRVASVDVVISRVTEVDVEIFEGVLP